MSPAPADDPTPGRDAYPVHRLVPTRWDDEDVYGHVNNVVHYAMFDTAVNGWLMSRLHELGHAGDLRDLPALGVVAETGCRYLAELRFPEVVTAGVRVDRLGTSSITYGLALFGEGSDRAAAVGRFVHVYVDRVTRRPVPVPDVVKRAVAPARLGT